MNKNFYLFAIFAVLVTGCSKDPIKETTPTASSNYTRSFSFPRTNNMEVVDSNQASVVTVTSYYNNVKALSIGFYVTHPSGIDQLNLAIKKDKLKLGLVGDYIISPFLTPGKPEGDIDVNYGYGKISTSAFFVLPGSSDGVLHISSYNEKYKMITGNFSVRINSDKDPRVTSTTVWENTQIDVTGSFQNLEIKSE